MDPNAAVNFDAHASVFGQSSSPLEPNAHSALHSLSTHNSPSIPSSQSDRSSPLAACNEGSDDELPRRPSNISRDHSQFMYYDLRPSARNGRTAFVTWLDADDSGNYDPSAQAYIEKGKPKQRCLVPFHRRRKRLDDAAAEGKDDDGENITVKLSVLAARQRGCSMVVSLKLRQPEAIRLMQKISQNWPGMYHNILSDEYIEQQVRQALEGPSSSWTTYNLRDRSDPNTIEVSKASAVESYLSDPANIELDLTNHPAARGCVACRRLGFTCPLLEDEADWPCHVCLEDGFDCELITPPIKKATCEECRRKRRACSFREQSTRSCRECVSNPLACVAGPAPTAIFERKSYERAERLERERRTGARRSYITCTACRTEKLKCSLKKMKDCPPCASCQRQGILCTFLPLPTTSKRPKKPEKQKVDSSTPQDTFGRNCTTPANAETIHTSLCHPITFLVLQEDCHWCSNLSYGILGLGWLNVTVVPSADGIEYEELRGGHLEQGQERSRMCTDCCMSRVVILNCPEHELRPLDGIKTHGDSSGGGLPTSNDMDLDDIEVEAAFDRLISNSVLPTDQWCHLCPSLALFQCCTPQEEDKWGEPWDSTSDEISGCGLLLCEDCAVALMEEGNLDGVLERMAEEEDEDRWAMGPRADAEFLSSTDNLLLNKVVDGLDVDEDMEMG